MTENGRLLVNESLIFSEELNLRNDLEHIEIGSLKTVTALKVIGKTV